MAISYTAESSRMNFYTPRTLVSDFDNFLNRDIPGAVMSFELVPNWYTRDTSNPTYVRGELYPDSTKSRYENTDNNLNIRFSKNSVAKRGDYIVQDDGTIYLLDWNIPSESNNKSSRAVVCNLMLNIKRFRNNPIKGTEVLVDDLGFVIEDEDPEEYTDYEVICSDIPCNAYHYDGRPEYSAVASHPGVSPNNLIILIVQVNTTTNNIKIDDYFTWGNEDFVIMDVNRVGVNLAGAGILKIQAKKKAGTSE